jgi:hypothetical protein
MRLAPAAQNKSPPNESTVACTKLSYASEVEEEKARTTVVRAEAVGTEHP